LANETSSEKIEGEKRVPLGLHNDSLNSSPGVSKRSDPNKTAKSEKLMEGNSEQLVEKSS
jgi:hypothetical protein